MELEKCDKCGVEVEKGTLIRDAFDASELRCQKCSAPDKKPRKPRKRKEKPVIAAATGILGVLATKREEEEVPPVDLIGMKKDAEDWARECGIANCRANGPERELFPIYGFGYVFQISEIGGKDRRATATYTSHGLRNFWSMDSTVTG